MGLRNYLVEGVSGTGKSFPPEVYPRLELLEAPKPVPVTVRYGDVVALSWGTATRTARRASTYAAIRTGEIGLVVDSYGLCSLALDRAAASSRLGLAPGGQVQVAVPQAGSGE